MFMRLLCLLAAILTQLPILNAQPTPNCVQCPSGLIAWWPGDGSTTNLAGTGDGSLQNGATTTGGLIAETFSLDGINDRVAIGETPGSDLSRQAAWTIQAWIRPSTFSNKSYPTIYSEGYWGISLGLNNGTGRPESWINNANRLIATQAVVLNEWSHVGLTSDGTNRIFYVNGVVAGSGSAPAANADNSGAAIGDVAPTHNAAQFQGLIDEVAIFNRTLSAEEIAAIYAAGTNGMCKDALQPTLLTWPTNQFAALGSNVTLAVTASGTEPLHYQWRFQGTNLPGATLSTLNLHPSTVSDSGPYSCLVSNAYGTATSPIAVLTVKSILDCGLLTNRTLVLRDSPYLLVCNLDLQDVAIEPGVRIEATGNFEIKVRGGLRAVGTDSQPIVFTTTNASTTKWQGILFDGSTADSELAYCIVENSINSGLRINEASPVIRHCQIRRNQAVYGAGIRITGSMPVTLEDCRIFENTYSGANPRGGGIHTTSRLTLIACKVRCNSISDGRSCWGSSATTYGGAIYSSTDVFLQDVEVIGNTASSSGGAENSRGGGVYTSGRLFAQNSIFANNYAGAGGCNIGDGARGYGGGIYCGSMLGLTNCIIANNSTRISNGAGGGVYAANGAIVNCTVAHNNAPGGVYFSGSGSIVNSILWGNSSYQFGGGATVNFSCVQGIVAANGNIAADPLLPPYDPATPENVRIPCGSPCVDAGNPAPEYQDAAGPLCVTCGTARNDMGANGGPGACMIGTAPEVLNNPETFEFVSSVWDTDSCGTWQIGLPTSGPPVNSMTGSRAYSPFNVAATLLGGNYSANSSGRLITPSFTVPAVNPGDLLVFRFWQWYQYGTGDSGRLQISVGAGTEWFPWETIAIAAPTNGSSGTWQQFVADLTPYQGQHVRLGFLHTANSDGSVGAGWYIDEVELSGFIPNPMQLSQDVTGTFNAVGDRAYYVLNAPPGGHLMLNLTGPPGSRLALYVRRGALPSAGAYDYRLTNPGDLNQLFVPDAQAGPWYVMIYADGLPAPGPYTLRTDFYEGIFLTGLTPTRHGNSNVAVVDIQGAGFDGTAWAWLVIGGTSIPATNVSFVSASRLVADFDLTTTPTNVYQLTVVQGTNSAALPFEVTQGLGPKLETKLVVPSRVGYHTLATLWVEFANTGDAAMPAPLLEVGGTQNGQSGAWLTLTEHRMVEGFWTSATPEGFAHSVQFLASGATPGLLQPGESGRVPVYYVGWKQPWDFRYPPIYFNLGILDANNTNAVDWLALKEDMRPGSLTVEQWEPVFWNLVGQTGPTWGDYVRMLNDNARYLHRLDIRVTDIRELLGFEVMQASGLSVTRTLASAVDAQVQTPGLPLTFTRSFSTDIPSHFTLGRLGRGWSDNWDRSLLKASDGTVTIFGPGGSRRVFKPDSRYGGRYFAPAGDAATLTPAAGEAYTLRESDGTFYAFQADGKLGYVADTHRNSVACTYSGGLLTRLTHSAGPYLDLAYSGNRVAAVTDSLGRTTMFTYDGSSEHLQTAMDYRGQTTAYVYELSGLTSAAKHALTKVFNTDGTESNYAYDNQGRLVMKSGCCGSTECTYYSYDSAGRVTATDALTNSTHYSFDHRGLLVRTENPLGGIVHRTFDLNGRLMKTTDAAGRSRTFAYDSRGNLLSETDQLGYSTRYTYTADFNRLASVLDAKGNLTRYAYQPDGALASITYADGSRESWGYDASGNRTSWTNRRGQTIYYTNDVLGRLIARAYPDGVIHTFNFDAQGNLASYTDPLGTTSQGFDADGRLAKITYPGDRWLGYTYDAAGRRALMTNELGYETRYYYDSAGRLERLIDERGSNIVIYAYDAAGRMALKTLGNGVYTSYTYDPAGQLLDLFNHKPDGFVLSRFQYTYDSRGRRDTMTTTYGAGDPRTDLSGLWRYDYDDVGQLIGWTAPWGRRVDYTYDALGNRLNVRDDGTNTAYTVNNLNQYTQVGSTMYQYDADGNLTDKVAPEGTTSYGWSFDNKLAQVTAPSGVWQNGYDAQGNRTHVVEGGTAKDLVIDPSELRNVVGEYVQGETGPKAVHSHGIGLVSRRSETDNSYYAFDALGSTSELFGDSPVGANAYAYFPFAELLFKAGSADDAFQFVGEAGVMTGPANLHFMRARHYDAQIGRFTSPDPIGISAGDVNLSRYVNNNPMLDVDPTGLGFWRDFGTCFSDCISRYSGGVPGFLLARLLFVCSEAAKASGAGGLPVCTAAATVWGGYLVGVAGGCFIGCILPVPTPPPNPNPIEYCKWYPENCRCFAMYMNPDPVCVPVPPTPPIDPNALTGPKGFGPENYIQANALFPYMIEFENATNALVPAQRVVLSNQLTNRLDWTTFELTEIAFGDQFIAVPPQTKHFEHTVKLRQDGYDFEVQIEAGIRLDTGEVYARFQSLNPTNGLPPSVDIGMLPPEDGTGRGMGHVSYVIRPNLGLATGTEIRNVAYIVFDQNPPIGTDWVDPHDESKGIDTNKQALVTIDADLPTSAITSLPATAANANFVVTWSGNDAGAGIAGYDVYVSTNGGAYGLWLPNLPITSATFHGENGRLYCFYSIARDEVGHVQTNYTVACTQTLSNYPPVIEPIPDQVVVVGQQLVITNRANDPDGVTFTLGAGAPTGASITTNGVFRWTPSCAQGSTTNDILIVATDPGTPPMSSTNTLRVIVPECIEASLGNTVMQAGTTSSVPIYLLSTVELTNLSFTVVYPPERFTNLMVLADTNLVPVPFTTNLSDHQFLVSFALPEAQVLYGPTNVGELSLEALAGQSSAFVPLEITEVIGRKPDGGLVGTWYGYPGRVVVIGPEPLLEAWRAGQTNVALTLYGNPGTTYQVNYSTNLPPATWWPEWTVPLTNLWKTWEVEPTAPQMYYRAVQD
ncbi:MAG: immunoglobulin domain-containing protein [Verrucomicrobia bacterium]|nr:immunoglobulin domain-containing protein [Verrucomicrobiota bacterium]